MSFHTLRDGSVVELKQHDQDPSKVQFKFLDSNWHDSKVNSFNAVQMYAEESKNKTEFLAKVGWKEMPKEEKK